MPAVNQQETFFQRLDIGADADERAIKRAYARELKLIDQETNIAGLQALREGYEAALYWVRHSAKLEQDAQDAQAARPLDGGALALKGQQPDSMPSDAMALGCNGEHADAEAEALNQGLEVFVQFQQDCMAGEPEMQQLQRVRGELLACLDDERLINITARQAFEQLLADLLAHGWKPGHEVLLVAAVEVFEWDKDRRRVRALGWAGYMLDAAIEQRAMYELQLRETCETQRQVIIRLRGTRPPSTDELITLVPILVTLEARFPNWIALITSTDQIAVWHELSSEVPFWRRKLTQVKMGEVGWILVAFFAFMIILSISSQPDVAAPVVQAALSPIDEGNRLMDSGEYQAAIDMFGKALENDPKDASTYARRAFAYIYLGDQKSALKDMATLEVLEPANVHLFRARGLLASEEDRHADAIAAFSRVLELDPTSAYAHLMRALCYEHAGQPDKALAGADEAIKLDAERLSAYSLRARIYKARGDKRNGLAQAAALLAANGKNGEVVEAAARIQAMFNESERAIATVEQGLIAAPTVNLHLLLSSVRPPSQYAARKSDIKAALLLDPQSSEALSDAADLEFDEGHFAEAVAAYDRAIPAATTVTWRTNLVAARAASHARLGNEVAAGADLKLAMSIASTPLALNNLCWNLAVKNVGLQVALDACIAGLAKSPDDRATLDSKGFVLMRLRRYPEAVAAYDAAIKKDAKSATSLFVRGVLKQRLGDVKGGAADMQAASAINANIAQEFAKIGVKP